MILPKFLVLIFLHIILGPQKIDVRAQDLQNVYEYFTEGGLNSGLVAEGPTFKLNGKPLRILSGAIHYFRVHPSEWRESLLKLRAVGANAVETYIAWNLHEPRQNQFDFGDGGNDFSDFARLEDFIKMAQEEDLLVLLRPGPYICAEWEFGGFPSWLLRDPGMKLRSDYGPYLERVKIYYETLLTKLEPLQFLNGGPVIAIQIENEYANWGPISKLYLEFIENLYKTHGFEKTLLYTADSARKGDVGSLPSLLKTANFRDGANTSLSQMLEFQPDKPLMVMEFWTGWFDLWTADKHETWGSDRVAKNFDIILSPPFNGSVNFYMFLGGTNFGFYQGASYSYGPYKAMTTSYDYDAPLTEAGDYTEKYYVIEEFIEKYAFPKLSRPEKPPLKSKGAYATILPHTYLNYEQIVSQIPPSCVFQMEELTSMENLDMNDGNGQSYGFIIYRLEDNKLAHNGSLFKAGVVKDFGTVLVDGVLQKSSFEGQNNSRYWIDSEQEIILNVDESQESHSIDLLIEEMGRVNGGGGNNMNNQRKGLPNGHISLDGVLINGFTVMALEFSKPWIQNLTNFQNVTSTHQAPLIVRSTFDIEDEPVGTYLDMEGWHKGIIFINEFNIGRYFQVGPQKRLYVPSAVFKKGQNQITIFELLEMGTEIKFNANSSLG